MRRAASYRDFWPLYLAEHSRPATRGLHLFGTALSLALLAAAAALGDWRRVPADRVADRVKAPATAVPGASRASMTSGRPA